MKRCKASFTYDEQVHAYYFEPDEKHEPPYRKQIHEKAIVDVAADGSLAGVEIIDPKMPKPWKP